MKLPAVSRVSQPRVAIANLHAAHGGKKAIWGHSLYFDRSQPKYAYVRRLKKNVTVPQPLICACTAQKASWEQF